MKLRNFLIIWGCLQFLSCNTKVEEVEYIIKKYYTEECGDNDDCIIDFNDLFPKRWDSVYIFNNAFDIVDINKQLGFELKNYVDVGTRIIFTKGKNVIYYQEWFPDPDNHASRLIFELKGNMWVAPRSKTQFRISRDLTDQDILYLEPLGGTRNKL